MALLPCVVQPSTRSTERIHATLQAPSIVIVQSQFWTKYYIDISVQVRCLHTDFHHPSGRFKWIFLLHWELYVRIAWNKAVTFHNICVSHATLCSWTMSILLLWSYVGYWGSIMETVCERDYWPPFFRVRELRKIWIKERQKFHW